MKKDFVLHDKKPTEKEEIMEIKKHIIIKS